jgi:hypothetical protein
MLLVYLKYLYNRNKLEKVGISEKDTQNFLKCTSDQAIQLIVDGNVNIRNCFTIEILVLITHNERIINPHRNIYLTSALAEKRTLLNENFYKSYELAAIHELDERSFIAAQKAVEYGSVNAAVYEVLQRFYFSLGKPYYDRAKGMYYLMLYFNLTIDADLNNPYNAFTKRINSLWAKVFRSRAKQNILTPSYSSDHDCDDDLTGAIDEICFYGSQIYSVTKWRGRFSICPHDIRYVFEELYLKVLNRVKKAIATLFGIWKFRRPSMKSMPRDVMKLLSTKIFTSRTAPLAWLTIEEIQLKQLIRSIKYFSEPKFQGTFDIGEIEKTLSQTGKDDTKRRKVDQ